MKNKLSCYEKSVLDLASKLPQWNSDDEDRKYKSAIFSLFEEAGEISGLISKKRIRKNYWKSNPKELEDYEEIRKAFIGELSDFLWVLICTNRQVLGNSVNFIETMVDYLSMAENDYENGYGINFSLEDNMKCLFNSLAHFMGNTISITNVFYNFCYLLISFNKEYDITLDELINYNMSKLDKRYNEKGERVDGR